MGYSDFHPVGRQECRPTTPNQEHLMSAFHLTVGDNMRQLRDWHEKTHTLSWAACPYEPCNHLNEEFRKCWR